MYCIYKASFPDLSKINAVACRHGQCFPGEQWVNNLGDWESAWERERDTSLVRGRVSGYLRCTDGRDVMKKQYPSVLDTSTSYFNCEQNATITCTPGKQLVAGQENIGGNGFGEG